MPVFTLGFDGFAGPLALLQGRDFESGGLLWDVLQGSFSVQGGMCRISATVSTKSIAVAIPVDDRDYLGAKITFRATIDNKVGVIARVQADGTSYYLAYFSRPYVHLFRVDSGVSTWLGLADVSATLLASSTMELRASGTSIKVFWNGAQVLSVIQVLYPLGIAGIQISEPGQWIDSFELIVDSGTTTVPPTTLISTTVVPTTIPPGPTTVPPTTILSAELTFAPTTLPGPTTLGPTTVPPTTIPVVTTAPPTTVPPYPVTTGDLVRSSVCYIEIEDRLVVEAWLVDGDEQTNTEVLDLDGCTLDLVDELGVRRSFTGVPSALGNWRCRFVIPQARLYAEHLYLLEISLLILSETTAKGPEVVALQVN